MMDGCTDGSMVARAGPGRDWEGLGLRLILAKGDIGTLPGTVARETEENAFWAPQTIVDPVWF